MFYRFLNLDTSSNLVSFVSLYQFIGSFNHRMLLMIKAIQTLVLFSRNNIH